MQRDHFAILRLSRFFADRRVAFLRLGLHRQLVAEGCLDGIFGAQMHHALLSINEDRVAVQCLRENTLGIDHQRNSPSARDNRGVTSDGAFLQHDAF